MNVEGTRRLLDRRACTPGVSSSARRWASIRAITNLHADESTPVRAAHSRTATRSWRPSTLVRERGGRRAALPRLAYGPGSDRGRMAALIRAVARGPLRAARTVPGARSLVAADNAAEAMVLALHNGTRAGCIW
jgi:hypothetical protein